jgi:hypothetical protein
MPRPALGERPMTATERSLRRFYRNKERHQRYEATLRDLLATADTGKITATHVAAKCREALGN